MALAQVRQQVVEDRADVAQVDLDVREGRRAERDDDVLGGARVGRALAELEPAGVLDALEDLVGAGLVERHASLPDRAEALRVVVDAEHLQAAVGEGQRQRQADTAEADDRDVVHVHDTLTRGPAQGCGARRGPDVSRPGLPHVLDAEVDGLAEQHRALGAQEATGRLQDLQVDLQGGV